MCVVSAMGDHYKDQFDPFKKYIPNQPIGPIPMSPIPNQNPDPLDWLKKFQKDVTREEFNELKRQVEEMKKILKVAAEYDARNNEPHCEIEDKVKLLKEIAKLVGVNLDDVFPPPITSGLLQTNIGDLPGSTITIVTGGTPGEVTTFNVDLRNIKESSTLTSNSGSL